MEIKELVIFFYHFPLFWMKDERIRVINDIDAITTAFQAIFINLQSLLSDFNGNMKSSKKANEVYIKIKMSEHIMHLYKTIFKAKDREKKDEISLYLLESFDYPEKMIKRFIKGLLQVFIEKYDSDIIDHAKDPSRFKDFDVALNEYKRKFASSILNRIKSFIESCW
ncbi:MAG: hypothetical protein ACTSRA_11355 [Promethearchaeota archaeon]